MQLDGAKIVQQITSLEAALPPPRPLEHPDSATTDEVRSQTESSGVSGVRNQDQTVSSLTSISNPDLDSLANQTVGSAGREAVAAGSGLSGGGVKFENAMNPEEILAMKTLLSKQLVDSLISLIAEIPLL